MLRKWPISFNMFNLNFTRMSDFPAPPDIYLEDDAKKKKTFHFEFNGYFQNRNNILLSKFVSHGLFILCLKSRLNQLQEELDNERDTRVRVS